MIEHLLTAHPVTGAIRALTPGLLREALLLPRPALSMRCRCLLRRPAVMVASSGS